MKLEDRGLVAMAAPASEAKVLEAVGAFGLHAVVVGLGLITLTSHKQAGVDTLKVGVVLAGAGLGAKYLAEATS